MRTLEQVAAAQPACRDRERRALVLEHPTLNGIDFVEYEHRAPEHVLVVHFLKDLPDPASTDGAYGLTEGPERVVLEGGARRTGIEVLEVRRPDPPGERLEVVVDRAGDFALYWLGLGWVRQPDGNWLQTLPDLDPAFSIAPLSFKASCPVDFDCAPERECPPEQRPEPRIDYLAKDYASFRRLLVDLIPRLNPDWLERNPADLGIALVELLAHEGDHLSYFQDAVAQEAHLDTVRHRRSARRHARLVDYRMHDGRNAWTWLHVATASPGTVGRGVQALTRVGAPLRGGGVPGPVLSSAEAALDDDPALAGVEVFETAFDLVADPRNNEIRIHDWGDRECCHPRGTTALDLWAVDPADLEGATRPPLAAGDFLLVEEMAGPITGLVADADPLHRQVVRIEEVLETSDPALADRLVDGRPRALAAGDTTLPILRVRWHRGEALTFPLCVSARTVAGDELDRISVVRGNMVLADHGRTVVEEMDLDRPVATEEPIRLDLARGPLSFQRQPDDAVYDGVDAVLATDRRRLDGAAGEAAPAVAVRAVYPTGEQLFTPVPDLLDSPPTAAHLVAEVDERGRASLRFGDDEYGLHPAGAERFAAVYRIGSGRPGNVGAEALAHLVRPAVAPGWPDVAAVRNPLVARGGADPETLEEVRVRAPAAFHAEQFRAVTEGDYAAAARKMPGVAGAVASFRWTGSWYTVYVGVDPAAPEDLISLPGGRARLEPGLAYRVHGFLDRYRLAGYDLEIRAADYVPLDVALEICVRPGYFRGDVAEAVRRALSSRVAPDGRRGFFHPDRFTFAQPVYLSRLYAAVEAVEGVDSVVVTRFRRFGERDLGELDRGMVGIGPWEIARLDNDPSAMENGVLAIETGGGK